VDTKQPAVLACVDGSNAASSVCDYAAWISRKTGAPLHFLHSVTHHNVPVVTDLSGSIGLGAQDELLQELTQIEQHRSKLLLKKGKLILEAAIDRAKTAGVNDVTSGQRHGALQENLVDLEANTRVLVLGLRGEQHDDEDSGVGHKIESVLRSLHRPMLVVNQSFQEPEKILLAYDGSEGAKKALDMVASSPLFDDIHCHVVFAGAADEAQAHFDFAQRILHNNVASIDCHRIENDLPEEVATLQSELAIDLMVMGAFSHGRLHDIFLGSVTSKVLENTAKPLLLLR